MGVKGLKMGYCVGSLLVVLLLVHSSHGVFKTCGFEECERLDPRFILWHIPNVAELNVICPLYTRCVLCLQDDLEKRLEMDVARSETFMKDIREIVTLSNLFLEVCDQDSDLHKGYVAYSDCVMQAIRPVLGCYKTAELVYATYKSTLLVTGEESEDASNGEKRCLISGYSISCTLGILNQQCGKAAGKTVVTLLSRVKNTRLSECSEDGRAKLRGPFLDMLEETEGVDTNIFKEVFSVMKRRK